MFQQIGCHYFTVHLITAQSSCFLKISNHHRSPAYWPSTATDLFLGTCLSVNKDKLSLLFLERTLIVDL